MKNLIKQISMISNWHLLVSNAVLGILLIAIQQTLSAKQSELIEVRDLYSKSLQVLESSNISIAKKMNSLNGFSENFADQILKDDDKSIYNKVPPTFWLNITLEIFPVEQVNIKMSNVLSVYRPKESVDDILQERRKVKFIDDLEVALLNDMTRVEKEMKDRKNRYDSHALKFHSFDSYEDEVKNHKKVLKIVFESYKATVQNNLVLTNEFKVILERLQKNLSVLKVLNTFIFTLISLFSLIIVIRSKENHEKSRSNSKKYGYTRWNSTNIDKTGQLPYQRWIRRRRYF